MNEVQAMLSDMQGRFLVDRYDSETRLRIVHSDAGWSADIWSELAELGLLAALLPEAHGGLGGGGEDLMILMEGFGRALLVEPYVSSVVIGGALFAELGDTEGLDAVAAGTMRVALAHDERPDAHGAAAIAATARKANGGFLLSGRKIAVPDAPSATHFLISARLDNEGSDLGLFLVPAEGSDVDVERFRRIDGKLAATLVFDDLNLAESALLYSGEAALTLVRRLLDKATVAVCAEAIGVMRAMLEQTVAYTRERTQFGKPLASFQVLRHEMVDMFVEIEQAQSLTLGAALSGGDGAAVSAAKIRVNDALRHVAHSAVQLHGGIGTTEELVLSQYFRRATAIQREYGTSAHHFVRVEQAVARDLGMAVQANDADQRLCA